MNAVVCLTCHRFIESTRVHEMVGCACKRAETRVVIDGGSEYPRMVCGADAKWLRIQAASVHRADDGVTP